MFDSKLMGKRIKELRGAVPQDQCAKELGISRGALSFYENGERKPDAEILYRMSEYFKASVDYLLGLSDVSSTNMEIQKICQHTGLSEKAVSNLEKYSTNSNKETFWILSSLIENEDFFELINSIYSCMLSKMNWQYISDISPIVDTICDDEELSIEARENFAVVIADTLSFYADALYANIIIRRNDPSFFRHNNIPMNYPVKEITTSFRMQAFEDTETKEFRTEKSFDELITNFINKKIGEMYHLYSINTSDLIIKNFKRGRPFEDVAGRELTDEEIKIQKFVSSRFEEMFRNGKHNSTEE